MEQWLVPLIARTEARRLAEVAREHEQARKDTAALVSELQYRAEQAEARAQEGKELVRKREVALQRLEAEAAEARRLAEERQETVNQLADAALAQPRRRWWHLWR